MQAVDINRLIHSDQLRQAGNWASTTCRTIAQLTLPSGVGFVTPLQEPDHHIILILNPHQMALIECKGPKKRQINLDWQKSHITLNDRLAQESDLTLMVTLLKKMAIQAKQTPVIQFNPIDFELKAMIQAIQTQSIQSQSLVPHPLAVIATIGKGLQRQTEAPQNRINAFINKTKTLYLTLKNGFNRLIIHNRDQKPRASQTYEIAISDQGGTYSESSHFVKNEFKLTFDPPALTINGTAVTETGCRLFSDKLATITQDLAGNRAEAYCEGP